MSELPCVLGIDGGGSKTLLALATLEGDIAVWRKGPGTNPFDQPDWRNLLRVLMMNPNLGVSPRAAAAGLAGHGELPEMVAAQTELMASLLPHPHSLHSDVQVAFDGAFLDRPGVLILAGTGSMAWAQTEDGQSYRVGGWGHGIGDGGSAFWIGQQAVALTSEVLDGRSPARDFAEAILAEIGPSPDGEAATLLRWYSTRKHLRSSVAGLGRVVDGLADRGDPAAQAIMRRAAMVLCDHVEAARRHIRQSDCAWSHAGSVFASVTVRETMAERLGPPTAPALPPIGGALWRAAKLAGWNAGSSWTARLDVALTRITAPETGIQNPS